MSRDSSAAPLLDLRPSFKAVMDVLALWDEILGVGGC